jgi:hypothetical protein
MSKRRLALLVSMVFLAMMGAASWVNRNVAVAQDGAGTSRAAPPASAAQEPVLVELFTSEGCSDCPAADALLAQLDQRQPVAGVRIIVLEQHVDYWNGDGWYDPFSSATATQRQQMYAFGHTGDQIFTPQMIVDGGDRFVGSDGRRALRAIQQAAQQAKPRIELAWAGTAPNGERTLRVTVSGLPGNEIAAKPQVFLAITEDHLHSNVRAGENKGRALDHDGVVRKWSPLGRANQQGEANFETQANVKLDGDWKPENVRAVVFVQDTHSQRVLGAAEIAFQTN